MINCIFALKKQMDIELLRELCISFPNATEDMPFGENYLVFRIYGKIFALTDLNAIPACVSLKCEPQYAEELREQYHEITAGYHLNKKHWNTILIGNFSQEFLKNLIEHSYEQVLKKIPKKYLSNQS